ncbi:MAG: hypothetical protein A2520_05050 [Deltaproteobacteria bacterium RIFOXYD12_FULL_53_23]|nr:MAG: hypothetical protein A2520_05050 [Deltaproteobacteria bacterium RIFOXYD12_FULL_53_23]
MILLGCDIFQCGVHHLADLGQASAAGGVFLRASAPAIFFLGNNVLHDQRPAMLQNIPAQVIFGVAKTVTDQASHENPPLGD